MNLTHIVKSPFVPRSKHTLTRIFIIKVNEMHYFSTLFGKKPHPDLASRQSTQLV